MTLEHRDGMLVETFTPSNIDAVIAREIKRQDEQYGPFDLSTPGGMRLALAVLGDEVDEALGQWREWRKGPDWFGVRKEVIQAAAIAHRILRDVVVEVVD